MILAKGLSLKYPEGTTALYNIDLQVRAGEIIYITGPSGSGKTSLLKLLMGVEYPTGGTLSVLGQPIVKNQSGKIRKLRKHLGPVFQEFKLIKGRTALENVMLGMRFLGISSEQMKERALSAIKRVGLEHKNNTMVENLSWGESQRIAIARAVARRPLLILADEPTGNLDRDNAVNILELMKSFADESTAVIITTHATHLIENEKQGRHIILRNGCIQSERQG
ncbi:MAG: cell division ATP-binding protein FtsE [Bacillota bacterium]